MIVFPPSTCLKPPPRIAKEKFYLGRPDATELKRLFTDEVAKIVWTNKLSPSSLNLPKGGVEEIEVFETTLTTQGVNPLVYKAIDAAVKPHSVLHLITTADHFEAVFGYALPGEKTARYYAKSWTSRAEAELKVDGTTMDAVYLSLMAQLGGTCSVASEGEPDVKAWQEQDNRRAQLEQRLKKLKAQFKNEKQMNKQFELSLEIKKLEAELLG